MSSHRTFTNQNIALSAAEEALRIGVTAAREIGTPMSIVLVDTAGQPKATVRMDGASILSYEVAFKKAWTAAAAGVPTASLHQFISADTGALLSMPHVDNLSVVAGGLPIRMASQCVGAVGVSGATSDADLKVAEAIVAALS